MGKTLNIMDMKKFKNPVFLFNTLVLAVFILLDFMAAGYSEGARRFPQFVLGIGIAVIAFWMLIYFVFPRAMRFVESQEEGDETDVADMKRFLLACFCVALSVLVAYLLGFLFLVPTALLSYGFLLGNRKKMGALIIVMVVTTVLFYLGFNYLLNIPLLKGAILDLT
ncbi:MAG: tripartite tricarboxylate transporter TctB family protein [Deltaproteobacteria bacterium]|nr:tripartite tricarboxylate transporter TctB family protein [Deltaproteobacteria bacterium]